jgi:molecular chaperone HscC
MDQSDPMTDKEIKARREALAALKIHPREESENAAVLARAARCYESFLGPARDQIGHWTTAFESALATQDPRVIKEARGQLVVALDQVEGERFL